jgi:hypothetical protein
MCSKSWGSQSRFATTVTTVFPRQGVPGRVTRVIDAVSVSDVPAPPAIIVPLLLRLAFRQGGEHHRKDDGRNPNYEKSKEHNASVYHLYKF